MHHLIVAVILIVVGVMIIGSGMMVKSMKDLKGQQYQAMYAKLDNHVTTLYVLGTVVILSGVALVAYELMEEDEKSPADTLAKVLDNKGESEAFYFF